MSRVAATVNGFETQGGSGTMPQMWVLLEGPCPVNCSGVGTRDDNLSVIYEHLYPEVLRILKEITETLGTTVNLPCPTVMMKHPMTGSKV